MLVRKKAIAVVIGILTVLAGFAAYRTFANQDPPLITFMPAETDEVLYNPYTGLVADARYPDIAQTVRLAYAKITWRQIEPRKGEFNFAAFEESIHFEEWKRRGAKIILRLVLDYPEREDHLDIPDWLYEEIGRQGTHYELEYGEGFSPDYANDALIRNHERLIQALGDRYNDDPAIAYVQLGSIGHWGEWHTWNGKNDRIAFPERKVADRYVTPYVKYFSHKKLMMRRPTVIAANNGMGLFNDAFGDTESTIDGFWQWYSKGYVSWLTGEKEPAMPQFWAESPSGGECAEESLYFEDERIEETIRQAKLTHVSWMGPSAPVREPAGGPLQANIDRFLKTIGYRFVLASESHPESAEAGDVLPVKLNIVNRGAAPFYFPWTFELSLSDADGNIVAKAPSTADIRKWLPGEHEVQAEIPLPESIAPGTYRLNAAILDPETGEPDIAFANEGRRADGRYPLGFVTVGS